MIIFKIMGVVWKPGMLLIIVNICLDILLNFLTMQVEFAFILSTYVVKYGIRCSGRKVEKSIYSLDNCYY